MSRATLTELADAAIDRVELAADELVDAIRAEQAAIRERDEWKDARVKMTTGSINALTGKPHSPTSAGEEAERTSVYRSLDDDRKERAHDVTRVTAKYEAAKLRARLAVVVAGDAA